MSKKAEWEMAAECLERIPVPGGWLYRYFGTDSTSASTTFVPKPAEKSLRPPPDGHAWVTVAMPEALLRGIKGPPSVNSAPGGGISMGGKVKRGGLDDDGGES